MAGQNKITFYFWRKQDDNHVNPSPIRSRYLELGTVHRYDDRRSLELGLNPQALPKSQA